MARAVCDRCRRWVLWRARRGTRLKDLCCPRCSGGLRAFSRARDDQVTNAAYGPEGYDPAMAWAR